jgi:hypothetical protein
MMRTSLKTCDFGLSNSDHFCTSSTSYMCTTSDEGSARLAIGMTYHSTKHPKTCARASHSDSKPC